MIWNGGLNTKFFDKNDGLTYEGIKISDKEAEELGDINKTFSDSQIDE